MGFLLRVAAVSVIMSLQRLGGVIGMAAIQVRGKVSKDGILTVRGLPALAGRTVEVTVREEAALKTNDRYPLLGKVIRYDDPFDPVAENEWDAFR